jgi:hypothetical protein
MSVPTNIPDNVLKHYIEYARDEKRVIFKPYIPQNKNLNTGEGPGGHSDRGGGYRDAGLSRIAMKMMVDQGRSTGAPFNMPPLMSGQTDEMIIHQETGWIFYDDRVLPAQK